MPTWHSCNTVAPVIMTPRVIGAATISGRPRASVGGGGGHVDFATLGRAPLRLGFGSRRVTSRDLQIAEAAEELLHALDAVFEAIDVRLGRSAGFRCLAGRRKINCSRGMRSERE